MTVPDPTAPTAADVIAEAVGRAMVLRTSPHEIAAAVVAAIRAMSVEQLADLIPDATVERQVRVRDGGPPLMLSSALAVQVAERLDRPTEARLVGPWRAEP